MVWILMCGFGGIRGEKMRRRRNLEGGGEIDVEEMALA